MDRGNTYLALTRANVKGCLNEKTAACEERLFQVVFSFCLFVFSSLSKFCIQELPLS